MLAGPFVVELIDHQNTMFVAELDKLAAIGVVTGANVVNTILLHQQDALLDGLWIGCSTQSAQRVVVGIAFQKHLLTIEFETIVWTNLYGADAEALAVCIYGYTSFII